ncbi:Retrovirus-related Pol polyprotein from transposon 17.6 [Abeliophyllum distichum]|uniref:Retrovirus-related Pol polyprotein from transposon 17.6 n=1 Tax=Abeliophyllum distichum TaxID=126358 RepID=A0ABD1RZM7_9LAMI
MEDNQVQDQLHVDEINNLAPIARLVVVNERDILMSEYMMPPIVENQFNIVYLPYGHDNFQLRPDVINLFSNNLLFYGMTDENSHYHISRFDEYYRNFKYHGVNEKDNFHEAWKIFKQLLRKCPSRGFSLAAQNHYVYSELAPTSRSSVDSATGGSIQNRSIGDLYDLYETMSEQFIMWPKRGLQKKATGIHEVDTISLVLAKIDALPK